MQKTGGMPSRIKCSFRDGEIAECAEPARLLAVFVVDTNDTVLIKPY